MNSKLASCLAVCCLAVAVTAVPTVKTASRQNGFVFAASTIGPGSVIATEPEAADRATVAPSPDPTPESAASPMATPPAVPASIDEPMTFAYNIGGNGTGEFMDDPVDWVIGETATFAISHAVIEGAPQVYADIYKSHRYGLVGSTWGYDIAVDNPGMYDCTLHYSEIFSEYFSEEANRTFKVEISGDASEEKQEAEFDVMVELEGAEFTPYTRTFEGIGVVNTLRIRETPSVGDAFLSGISCSYKGPVAMA